MFSSSQPACQDLFASVLRYLWLVTEKRPAKLYYAFTQIHFLILWYLVAEDHLL